jgi:hypothetical protein
MPELNPKKAALEANAAQLAKILDEFVSATQGEATPEFCSLKPGQQVGARRFTLVKPLGRGGMGVVWLAQDTRLDESVALKFLPPGISSDSVALNDLRRETVRSHRLTHPNIIRIHDFQQSDEIAFISMEYVDGATLSDRRLQQTRQVMTWEQLAPLVQQLCAALEYAHGEKVIHRDLKPSNMMVDSKGRLKLADFGIAAVASDSVSRVSVQHATSGTPPYMSPQQLAGKRPQVTDDIYALGATLYELLTGKPPFYTGDITHQVMNQAPEPIEERLASLGIDNEIPPAVRAVVMACLAKEPEQRPQSARAVAEWIGLEPEVKHPAERPAAAHLPPPPHSPGPVAAGRPTESVPAKPARKGRVLAAVGIVALVLVMAGAFWLRKDAHSDWISPQVPKPDADGWIVLFDGKRLYGCSPSAADIASGRISVQDGCLRLDSAGIVFNLTGRDVVIRARLQKVSGRNCSLGGRNDGKGRDCGGWFNGANHFGIGHHLGGLWINVADVRAPQNYSGFFEMEYRAEGSILTLKADGQTICTGQDNSITDGALSVNAWLGITLFQSIEARILDKTSSTATTTTTVESDAKPRMKDFDWTLDTSQSPDLKDWAETKLKPVVDQWYPRLVDYFASDGFTAPTRFKITIRPGNGNVSFSGTTIQLSESWVKEQISRPGDWNQATGAVIWALARVVQQYGDPPWLAYGVANYYRWFIYEPAKPKMSALSAAGHNYSDRNMTESFLDFVVNNHDPKIVSKMNAAMRQGRYSPDLWKEYTGKSAEDLWAEFLKSL